LRRKIPQICADIKMPQNIHAHIGHYAGLLQLGREVMGAHTRPGVGHAAYEKVSVGKRPLAPTHLSLKY
jgi:hypothetical protein